MPTVRLSCHVIHQRRCDFCLRLVVERKRKEVRRNILCKVVFRTGITDEYHFVHIRAVKQIRQLVTSKPVIRIALFDGGFDKALESIVHDSDCPFFRAIFLRTG